MTLSVQGATASLNVPGAPNSAVGQVANDGSSLVTVTLDGDSSPAAIETLLEGVTLTGGDPGTGTVTVELTDGQGNSALPVVRDFEFAAFYYKVPGDFDTVQAAVDQVAATSGASGSIIEVSRNESTVEVGQDGTPSNPNLEGLSLRSSGSRLRFLFIYADSVSVTGFRFSGFLRSDNDETRIEECDFNGGNLFVAGDQATVINNIFQDCSFPNALGGSGTTITGNTFRGCNNTALIIADLDSSLIFTENGFFNNPAGHLEIRGGAAFSGNEFSGTGQVASVNFQGPSSPFTVNAANNWWGSADGPSPGQISQGADTTLISTPFLTVDPLPLFP